MFWIGPKATSAEELCPELNLTWVSFGSVKSLGILIPVDGSDAVVINFNDKIKSIEKLLGCWLYRGLTIIGKIVVCKSLGLSQIVHLLRVFPTPLDKLQALEDAFYNFIWNSKPPQIKRDVIIQTKECGGLNMTDLVSFSKALKTTWIKKLFDPHNLSEWKFLFLSMTKMLGGNSLWYHNSKSLSNIALRVTNPFWKEILLNWAQIAVEPSTVVNILNAPLWHNSNIMVGGNPAYYNALASREILYVYDIVNHNNGSILSYVDFKTKFNVGDKECNFLRYKSLCSAIPKQWKDLLNNDFSVADLLDDASFIKDLNSETKLSKLFYVKFLNVKLDKLTANQRSPTALAKWQSSDWFDQNLSWEDIF